MKLNWFQANRHGAEPPRNLKYVPSLRPAILGATTFKTRAGAVIRHLAVRVIFGCKR